MKKIIDYFSKFIKTKKTIYITILSITTIILFIVILSLLSSYALIGSFFDKFLNLKIDFIKPHTSFNSMLDANFNAEKIIIYNHAKTKQYIVVYNPKSSIKPLNLIFKKVNVKKSYADKIEIKINKFDNGKIDLLEDINKKNVDFLIKSFKTTKLNSEIKKVNLIYTDNNELNDTIVFSLDDTKIDLSKKNKRARFLTQGEILSLKQGKKKTNLKIDIKSKYSFKEIKPQDLKIDVDVKNLNLLIFNDLFKKYISKDIKLFSGNLDLYIKTSENNQKLTCYIYNHKIELQNKNTTIPYNKRIEIHSLFNLDKNLFNLNDLNIFSNDLNIQLKGSINKLFSLNPQYDISANIINTQLNNLLQYIPDNAIFYNPDGADFLKNSNFHALLNGGVNFKYPSLDMTGNIKVQNVYIPTIKKASKQNDVNIYFMKDKMRIYTRVYTPDKDEYVLVDGISNLDKSLFGKYTVKSTNKIDLNYAQKYLVPIQKIFGFDVGPVSKMELSGFGNIDIKTQGTIFDGQIYGKFVAYNATAKLNGIAARLNNGVCEILFDNKNIIIKKVSANIDNAVFLLTGNANTKGNIDLKGKLIDIQIKKLLDIFNNSLATAKFNNLTKDISAVSGKADCLFDVNGIIKNFDDENYLNNLNIDGSLILKNNKIFFNNGAKLNSVYALMKFGKEQSGQIKAKIGNSNINMFFSSKTPLKQIEKNKKLVFTSKVISSKISSSDIIKNLFSAKLKYNFPNFFIKADISSSGEILLDNLNITKLKNQGYIIGLNDNNLSDIVYKNGCVKLEGSKVIFDNLILLFQEGEIKASGKIDDILSNYNPNLKIALKNIKLNQLENIFTKTKFENSQLKSGEIYVKNDTIKLNNMNIYHNNMPLFFDGQIKNIYTNKFISGNFSTILSEYTVDNIINPYLEYPIKIKGEIPIRASINGKEDDYSVDLTTNIPVDSDISFSGANIGDTNYKREISGKIEVNKNIAKINNLKLIKFIANQNNKINPLLTLKINGTIQENNKDLFYKNFKITTFVPMNVRMLNLIFKKSLLKKGNFECDINVNGNFKAPSIIGNILLEDLDIPLYDTKINDIDLNITDKYINGKLQANSKNSDLNLFLKAVNNLKPPYIIEQLNIFSNKIDIISILNSLSIDTPKSDISKKQDFSISPQDIIIKEGNINVNDVQYEKISASNLVGNFSYDNNILNVKNVNIDIAQGEVKANGNYNIATTKLHLDAQMLGCDSNILAKEFLNISEQIFGKMNGSITLNGKGLNTPNNIKNIRSNVAFSIENGKMPKLGSLEYLLRAGNTIKAGILGLSLNNLIQILSPYKTGEFENINGTLTISNGEVKNMEIISKGKNLSLYLVGNYDILKNFADLNIYGRLSQSVSTALGTIANASLKQFIDSLKLEKIKNEKEAKLSENLKKIPSVDSENTNSKFFSVKVLGDINKDNYIKSFNWE